MANTSELLTQLGQRIASYRISRGLKQADLATAAGVDRTTISRLEKGKATLDTLARVMAALDVEDRLLNIVPDAGLNPLDPMQVSGRQRYRVRDKARAETSTQWSWGDDTE